MTATTIRVQMAQRKDTAANWTAANPILLSGEIGYETDTKKFKIGNGSTNWNSLAYLPIPDGSGNLTITGNLEIGSTGSLTFEGSTADGFETTLAVTNPTADRTITLPDRSGTVITSGDTGTVTSTMLADGTIVNADISATAEIAVSKLANGTANQIITTDGTDVSWSSNLNLAGNATIQGDLTVNGTTTTIDSQTLLVEDKNIEMGVVATPTDVTADGGGITLRGTTNKTINWIDSTDSWTSSEHVDLASGKNYRINNTQVLSSTTLGSGVTGSSLTSVGTIGTGVWQGTAISATYLDATLVKTSDTGTVTSTMIANGTIVDADINASAAIAGTKISPDFGSQNVTTTGTSTAASFIPSSSIVPTNGVYLPAANSVAISTSSSERIRIGANGEIGLGGANYGTNGQVLTSAGSGAAPTWQTLSVSANSITQGNTNATVTDTGSDGRFVVTTEGTERLRVDSSGRLGVGTTSPGSFGYFAVRGSAALGGSYGNVSAHFSDGATTSLFIKHAAGELGYFTDGAVAQTFYTSSTERARIDSSGRLLVGTSSTSQTSSIVVQGNSSSSVDEAVIRMANGSSTPGVGAYLGNLIFTDSGHQTSAFIGAMRDGGTWSASSKPSRLVFSTTADGASSPTERMRIASDGSVLQYGNGNGLTAASAQSAGTTFTTFRGKHSASSTTTGTDSFLVYTNGNVQNTNNSYTAISDIKLKENIADAGSQWDDLKALRVRNYNLKEGQTHKQIGLIAQEVEPISPGLVYETPDRDAEGNDLGTTTKAVQYSVLYMKAVKALQEAMERIEVLEQRLADAGIA